MLEEDYRLICLENGISSSLNLSKAKEIDSIEVEVIFNFIKNKIRISRLYFRNRNSLKIKEKKRRICLKQLMKI